LACRGGEPTVTRMPTSLANPRVGVAWALAKSLLENQGDRWEHTIGVAQRAEELATTVDPSQQATLLVAAWLHDIGYSPAVAKTGFHPLDGAACLDHHGWPGRIAALVAHHSGADFLARAYGLQAALDRYPSEGSPIADALTYADQTTGPSGQRLPIRARMAEMLARHGPESAQAWVHHLREPHPLAVARRVRQRMGNSAAPEQSGEA